MITFSRYYWETFVKKYSYLLNWPELSRNSNISFEIFLENLEKCPWNYKIMLSNVNITLDHIIRHPLQHKDWSIKNSIKNPNTTLNYILKTPELQWDIDNYLMNPNACVEEIMEKVPDLINSMNVFFLHPNAQIKPSTLLLFPDYHWNWKSISKSVYINFDFVNEHPELPWNMSALSENPNITVDHVNMNPRWNWDMSKFSSNPSVNMDVILNNQNMDWKISSLLRNSNLTFDEVVNLCEIVPSVLTWTKYHHLLRIHYYICLENENFRFEDVTPYLVQIQPTLFSQKEFRTERKQFENTVNKSKQFVDQIEEELISKVYHPRRLNKLIEEYGYNEAVEMWND